MAGPPYPPLTPRRATWPVLRYQETRTKAKLQQLAQLHAQQAEVAEAIDLALDFVTIVCQLQPEHLDLWRQRTANRAQVAWERFAKGICEDYDAVKAGVT